MRGTFSSHCCSVGQMPNLWLPCCYCPCRTRCSALSCRCCALQVALLFIAPETELPHDMTWTAWMREARGMLPRGSLAGPEAFCLQQCDASGLWVGRNLEGGGVGWGLQPWRHLLGWVPGLTSWTAHFLPVGGMCMSSTLQFYASPLPAVCRAGDCARRCGAAAACNPLCVAAVQDELSPKRSAAVLQQQHLFSVYVHARAAYKDYPEGSVFQGRLIPDRAVGAVVLWCSCSPQCAFT